MAQELNAAMIRAWLPPRPEKGHKGTFGHLFVLAGSRGFTGAAKLTCMGAYRAGAGLVTLGIPHPLADVVAAGLLETMSLPLPATEMETFSEDAAAPALAFASSKDAVVLGPGLSRHPDTTRFVHACVTRCPVPLLVDADGLNALSENMETLLESTAAPLVLTPHPGEMARLADCGTEAIQRDREAAAAAFSRRYDCVVVLKGFRTVIAGPGEAVYVNTTGNSGLGTGGTGDVLSGVIGGLLAQRMSPLEAACVGVYAHGLAGDLAAAARTQRGMTAGDVVEALPEAWRELESSV